MPHLLCPYDWISHGFRDKVAAKQKRTEFVHSQLQGFNIPGEQEWFYTFPGLEDVYERSLRFNSMIPDLPCTKVPYWTDILRRSYPDIRTTRIVEFEDLQIRPQSSSGPLADSCARNKGDLLLWFGGRLMVYWERMIDEGWPIYWKTAGKVEMLQAGKKPRTFVFMDAFANMCFARCTADFNTQMKMHRHYTMSKIGISIYGREFIEFAERLARWPWVIEADVSQWDANFPHLLFSAIRAFRKEKMVEPYGQRMLDKKYDSLSYPLVFMPTGELVEFRHGNMSGQDSTSNDNTLGHTCLAGETHDKVRAVHPDFEEETGLYGDDIITSTNHPETYAKFLRETYVENGFVVKDSAFKVRKGLEGATFLGGKFKRCETHGHWTYVPSKRKLMDSLAHCYAKLTDEEFVGKVHSLYVLGFHTKWREIFRLRYVEARKLLSKPPPFWTERDIENFVHGLEGPVPGGKLPDQFDISC